MNGEIRHRKTYDALLVTMNVINSLTPFFLGVVACAAFILVQYRDWSAHFSQHVYLCVTGYVILMGTATMTFDPNTSWSRNLKYKEKKYSHIALQVIGSVLVITGSIIRMVNVNSNFQSPHGILGIIAMILTILTLLGGLLSLFLPNNNNRLFTKIVHSSMGSVTVAVAFICLCLGFNSTFRTFMGDAAANMSITFTAFALFGILLPPTINTLNRVFNF